MLFEEAALQVYYPSANELLADSGKLQLLDRLLVKLKQDGHKVLIFSQVCASVYAMCFQ